MPTDVQNMISLAQIRGTDPAIPLILALNSPEGLDTRGVTGQMKNDLHGKHNLRGEIAARTLQLRWNRTHHPEMNLTSEALELFALFNTEKAKSLILEAEKLREVCADISEPRYYTVLTLIHALNEVIYALSGTPHERRIISSNNVVLAAIDATRLSTRWSRQTPQKQGTPLTGASLLPDHALSLAGLQLPRINDTHLLFGPPTSSSDYVAQSQAWDGHPHPLLNTRLSPLTRLAVLKEYRVGAVVNHPTPKGEGFSVPDLFVQQGWQGRKPTARPVP